MLLLNVKLEIIADLVIWHTLELLPYKSMPRIYRTVIHSNVEMNVSHQNWSDEYDMQKVSVVLLCIVILQFHRN